MSPAGEALAMLPPSVPRFWICAAPIVAAASTSAGQMLAAERGAADVGVRRQRAEDDRIAIERDAAQLVEPPQVDHPLRRLADLAGEADHQVRAAGDRRARPASARMPGEVGRARPAARRHRVGALRAVPAAPAAADDDERRGSEPAGSWRANGGGDRVDLGRRSGRSSGALVGAGVPFVARHAVAVGHRPPGAATSAIASMIFV